MSFNRLRYDTCAYKQFLDQSTGVGAYQLYGGKYNHCSECRMELGIVGGNDVSLYSGNLVDLESDLRGQTRAASQCPSHKYQPTCRQPCDSGLPSGPSSCNLVHKPPCQMIRYPPTVLPPSIEVAFCPELYQSSLEGPGAGRAGDRSEPFCGSCAYPSDLPPPPSWVPPRPQTTCPPTRNVKIPAMCGGRPSCPRCLRAGQACRCR